VKDRRLKRRCRRESWRGGEEEKVREEVRERRWVRR